MTTLHELPLWGTLLVSALILLGSGLTFIGTLGLLRLRNFYERVHAPTLGATMGMASILLASMLYFSLTQTRPAVHELLIGFFITIGTPITLLMLVQATLYRDRLRGRDPLEAQDGNDRSATDTTES